MGTLASLVRTLTAIGRALIASFQSRFVFVRALVVVISNADCSGATLMTSERRLREAERLAASGQVSHATRCGLSDPPPPLPPPAQRTTAYIARHAAAA